MAAARAPRNAMAPIASVCFLAQRQEASLPQSLRIARLRGSRGRDGWSGVRRRRPPVSGTLSLPSQPVRNDGIRRARTWLARACGDDLDGLFVERQSMRNRRAIDRGRGLRRGGRRRRGFASRCPRCLVFIRCELLSRKPCRPCTVNRDGISIGEARRLRAARSRRRRPGMLSRGPGKAATPITCPARIRRAPALPARCNRRCATPKWRLGDIDSHQPARTASRPNDAAEDRAGF